LRKKYGCIGRVAMVGGERRRRPARGKAAARVEVEEERKR
jgi:hypothetical protein